MAISKQQTQAFERFGVDNLPIEDASGDILVTLKDVHCSSAIPGDPRECAIAQAFREQHGATVVLIFRSVAYVDLTNKRGKRVLMRFIVPARTRDLIIVPLDLGKTVVGQQVWLSAPPPSDRLDARLVQSREVRARHNATPESRAAWIKKQAAYKASHKNRQGHLLLGADGVRVGTGIRTATTIKEAV